MRIAISARERDLDSSIDRRFEKAKFYVIIDLDNSMGYEILANPLAQQLHTSGILLAQHLINLGVNAVFTGECDPNTSRVFKTAGVKVNCRTNGTVKDILAEFNKGVLFPLKSEQIRIQNP